MKKTAKFIVRMLDHLVKFYGIIIDPYGNVPLLLYALGFKPGISGGRCQKL